MMNYYFHARLAPSRKGLIVFAGYICMTLFVSCGVQRPRIAVELVPLEGSEMAEAQKELDTVDCLWSEILSQVVTKDGFVRWGAFQRNEGHTRDKLCRLTATLGKISPENCPGVFTRTGAVTSYWINAYNALSMCWIINHGYPERVPFERSGKFTVGGIPMCMADLQERATGRFTNYWMAINFGARSCPPLRREPYRPAVLTKQLAEQYKTYLNNTHVAMRVAHRILLDDWVLLHKSNFESVLATGSHPTSGVPDAVFVATLRALAGPSSEVFEVHPGSMIELASSGFDWALNWPQ